LPGLLGFQSTVCRTLLRPGEQDLDIQGIAFTAHRHQGNAQVAHWHVEMKRTKAFGTVDVVERMKEDATSSHIGHY